MNTLDIEETINLEVPLEDAWRTWTEPRLLKRWLCEDANVEIEVGGNFELFWDLNNRSLNSTIGCKVIAMEPNRRLAFQWRGPPEFSDLMNVSPFPTSVSIEFEKINLSNCIVHFRHSGWGESERWILARDWQNSAWLGAFAELRKLLGEGQCRHSLESREHGI